MNVGILADTHGHVNARIHALFQGVDAILHAGDIDTDDVLRELETIAPVTAVRGNMDQCGRPAELQHFVVITLAELTCFMTHDLGAPSRFTSRLQPVIAEHQPQVIIFGHTHQPYSRTIGGVLYFNPGSATSGRSAHKQTVGLFTILEHTISPVILPL